MPATCSSTRWCRTRPTARCCASRDARFTLASPKCLESQFADIAESQPELLARHCTEAGLIEKAAGLWGKAGQRSLERSALVEAVDTTHACAQTRSRRCPPTPALRREQIELQVALITPLMHVKGYAAPETKAAVERARLLIEQAEALGEPPEDPLLLFSVLYGFWAANFVAFNGDVMRELAAQFLTLAEKQGANAPAHDGTSPHGYIFAVYGRHRGRTSASRSGDCALRSCRASTAGDAIWSWTSGCMPYPIGRWPCGCSVIPMQPLADSQRALNDAREIGQAATLMYALVTAMLPHICCGNYAMSERRSLMNLWLWRTKKAHCYGRH